MDQNVANNEVKIMDSCESPDNLFKGGHVKTLNSSKLSRLEGVSYEHSPMQSKRASLKPLNNDNKIKLKLMKQEPTESL